MHGGRLKECRLSRGQKQWKDRMPPSRDFQVAMKVEERIRIRPEVYR
jgi:hypothetical protein